MSAELIPFHRIPASEPAGDPNLRTAEHIAHTYIGLRTRYAADRDAINRDAMACRSTDDLMEIQRRTLDTTTGALDAIAKLCGHVIETYACLLAPGQTDRG